MADAPKTSKLYQPLLDDDDDRDDGNDEDPEEGAKRKATSSALEGIGTFQELEADEGGAPSPTKRGAEARGINGMSDDHPVSTSSTSSEFRAGIRRVCSLRSVRDVEKLLNKEELRYNEGEEVHIEEFEGLEAEIVDEEETLKIISMKS